MDRNVAARQKKCSTLKKTQHVQGVTTLNVKLLYRTDYSANTEVSTSVPVQRRQAAMPKKPPKAGRFWRARKTAQCRCYVLIKRRFPSYLRTGQRAALREHREHREHREQEALKHRRDETGAGSCSFFRPTHPTSEQREKHTMATQPQRARSAHRRGTKEPTLLPPPSDSPGNGAGSGGGHNCGNKSHARRSSTRRLYRPPSAL